MPFFEPKCDAATGELAFGATRFAPGEYLLTVFDEHTTARLAVHRVTVTAPATTFECPLALPGTPRLVGRIVDGNGDPIPHARVVCLHEAIAGTDFNADWVSHWPHSIEVGFANRLVDHLLATATADAAGRFVASGLVPGRHRVIAVDVGDRLLGPQWQIEVPDAGVCDAEFVASGIVPGVVVGSLDVDGPAAKAGAQIGDRITTIDGEEIRDAGGLARTIRRAWMAGKSTVTLGIVREGASASIVVPLPAIGLGPAPGGHIGAHVWPR